MMRVQSINFQEILGYVIILSLVFLFPIFSNAQPTIKSNIAFYYGDNPPLAQLKLFNKVVLEPSKAVDPKQLETANRKIYAYVSLGEVSGLNHYKTPIDKQWVIGKNHAWQTLVLDQSNPAWQAFFIKDIITPLWDKGYRGFFLDTLDSYALATKAPDKLKKQQAGIIHIIQSIKAKYPEAKIIVNRGFELIPQIKGSVDEVVAESLFESWNNKTKRYVAVKSDDRRYLLKALQLVKKAGLPITIIDYVGPNQHQKAKDTAKKIADLGFNPWITNGDLTQIYLFNYELIPRKILLLYSGKINDVDAKLNSTLSRVVAMPLNYLGYVTILQNSAEPLPKNLSAKEYAGIVVANNGLLLGREDELYRWYLDQIQKKIPLVVLNDFGFTLKNFNLKPFGLSIPDYITRPHSVKVIYQAPMIGYEIRPVIGIYDFVALNLLSGTSLLTVETELGEQSDLAAIMPWGGYFMTQNYLVPVTETSSRWSINPFEFFKKSLQLPNMPVPDLTTENGRRLMFVHIDGDGFANKGEWYKGPYMGEVMLKEFFEAYKIPTTVSIVQAEIASNGLYPKLTAILEPLARKIFALPYIEIASHTFSHPYNWQDAAAYKGKGPNPYSLAIPNYKFNLETEINGSVKYINEQLAPKDKKCKVFLWSGEGDVPERALQLTYELGLANMNPGTIMSNYNNSISRASPLGLFYGKYYQVMAPIGNDHEANLNAVFLYSTVNLIDGIKLTETPMRLKPIDIYIHFFTVAQLGGVKALHQVYQWALAQSVMNIYASDYFYKVQDFNQLMIAKKEGGWLVTTNDFLRELRIPESMGYPDLVQSDNIIGYNVYQGHYYVHMGPGGDAFLITTKTPPTLPYLVDANSSVTRFVRTDKGIDFSLKGHMAPQFVFANIKKCTLWNGDKKIEPHSQQGNQKTYVFSEVREYDFSIQCD